ncbi:MAG: winged helix-turn-helix domain-containing protein [Candidatus Dojkabacteria bacterium]|jgi:predicted nucleotidyltransferase|nr:winged helix-turn-helix domain-containing protein [Candidatus Dojkabacteria bacterium]
MLKKILISRVRIRILEKYLLNPNSSFHVRGLVRELNEEINAVRRELINLESAGLLKSKKDKNMIVYTLDNSSDYITELRTLFFKNSKMGSKVVERIKGIDNLEAVVLTESFLSGKDNSAEDIDMLFLGNIRVKDVKDVVNELEKDLEREIRATAMKQEDFEFAKKKKDPVITNLLNQKLIQVYGDLTDLL